MLLLSAWKVQMMCCLPHVAAASGWNWVGTWSLIRGGCYHVTEVGGLYGLWDPCWSLSFKITWTLWNYWRYNKYLFILVEVYQPVTSCRDWYECCRPVLMIMFIMFVEKPLFEQWLCCLWTGTLSPYFPVCSNSTGVIECTVCWTHINCLSLGLAAL